MQYLKDKQYYIDLYDRLTVDSCRITEKSIKNTVQGKKKEKKLDEARVTALLYELVMYHEIGGHYEKKETTIQEWMSRDKLRDEKVANAEPIQGICCLYCGDQMKFTDKHLHEEEGGERILFWYECARCNKRRLFYDNNNEWRPRSHPCPKCRTEKKSQNSRKGDVITTIYSCPNCKHEETDILDLSTPKEKIDKNYEKDRLRFCLNDEQGREYLQGLINMEQLGKTIENIKEREENKELYEAVEAINKIPFGEVQKMLSDAFEKDGYTNLQFKAPEMQKGVVVEFTAVDSKTGRQDYDSRRDLKKIIETILAGTNWRLMSDGISYNLGFLSGRIKGVQSEEDLIKLIPKK